MYIHNLTLQRFRGAQDLSLELDDKLNVFVGMNGAGKSSILDASAIMLSWLANRIKHAGASGRPIAESDIKNGESSAIWPFSYVMRVLTSAGTWRRCVRGTAKRTWPLF
ncbi:MAG: ATPase [Marinobacter sp. T13-3]|nr:MAG: ATPase [Marinobacter sp. T13-3]